MQRLSEVDQWRHTTRRVALFTDFGGTLASIVEDPATAQLSRQVRETLRRLVRQESVVTTVISGRAVEDVYVRVRMEGVIYAGHHGLEIIRLKLRQGSASHY